MKKKVLALVLCLAAVFMLCACGSTTDLKMATGSTTGTYYAFGGIVAGVFEENIDGLKCTVHASGASKSNIFELIDGEADIALAQNDVTYYALTGTDLFASEGKQEGFSVMAGAYPEICQIVATKDITDISQLEGKRVSVGDAGSGTEFNARQILEAYGLTFDDIDVQNLDFGNSATALKDGKIDAFFCVAGAPTTNIVDLCTTTTISLLPVDDEHAAALQSNYSFYTTVSIPGGTYNGVDGDVQAVAVKATFLVSDKLSDDVVYKMTKSLFEDKDQMEHDKAAFLDPAYAVAGFDDMPIHPGALKYYQEVGVR